MYAITGIAKFLHERWFGLSIFKLFLIIELRFHIYVAAWSEGSKAGCIYTLTGNLVLKLSMENGLIVYPHYTNVCNSTLLSRITVILY